MYSVARIGFCTVIARPPLHLQGDDQIAGLAMLAASATAVAAEGAGSNRASGREFLAILSQFAHPN